MKGLSGICDFVMDRFYYIAVSNGRLSLLHHASSVESGNSSAWSYKVAE